MYEVIIVGGGPAGLSAALTLGRARKRVLLCDGSVPRNARAHEVHNFVTRDGTPPVEFRRIAREQLAPYETVELHDGAVDAIEGVRGAFSVQLAEERVDAHIVLLCVGMVDDLPALPGYRELWGHAIFQCPYCHGWEVRDRPFGYLASSAEALDRALLFRNWSRDLVAFTDGRYEVPTETRTRLSTASVRIEERPIERLLSHADADAPPRLQAVQLKDGARIAREILFAHPPQRQTALVAQLGLALDEQGYVRVDPMQRQTSREGIYAAGDLTTMLQAAIVASASGMQAAAMINHTLAAEGDRPAA